MHTGVKVESCVKNNDVRFEHKKKGTWRLFKKCLELSSFLSYLGEMEVRFVNLQLKTNDVFR